MNEPLDQLVNEVACRQFEQCWFDSTPVQIETCLDELPDQELLGTIEEIICIEMEFLWKQWSRAAVARNGLNKESVTPTSIEQYLQRFPQLNNSQQMERLVCEEINCRLQVNDKINPAEYLQRFPVLSAESSLVRDRLGALQQQHDTGQDDKTLMTPGASPSSDQTAHGKHFAVDATLQGSSAADGDSDGYLGRELGGYRILDEIGRGGIGVVYKSFDTKLKRIVALKVLRNFVHSDATDLERFLGEATAVAQMDHANIISIFEVGEDQGTPFVVFEFARDGSLKDRLDGTPYAPRKAAQLVLTLAQAIHAAHEKGIVHRDLKPGNIVFTANDELKITDFGLAKWIHEGTDLTKTGEMVGTPSYMAPEQIAGKAGVISAATDVYALGVILYELLTGRPPFTSSSSIDTVLHVLDKDPVPPNRLQVEIGRDLNTICLKCLEKQPGNRYHSAAELAADVQAYLEDRPITARRPSLLERSTKWMRRHPATSGFISVATVLAIALVFAWIKYSLVLQAERDKAQENEKKAQLAAGEAVRQKLIARGEKQKAEENESLALHAQYVNSISLSQLDLETSNFDGARDRLQEIKSNTKMAQHHQFELDMLERVTDGSYYELQTPAEKPRPGAHKNRAHFLDRFAAHPDQTFAVTGSQYGQVNLWNLQTRSLSQQLDLGIYEQITAIRWLPGNKVLVCGTMGAHLFSLQLDSDKQFQLVQETQLWKGPVQAAAVHVKWVEASDHPGRLALAIPGALSDSKSDLVILDVQSGAELHRITDEPLVHALAYNQDGSQLAVGTNVSLVLYSRTAEGWARREIRVSNPSQKGGNWRVIKSVLFWEQNNTPLVLSAGHDKQVRAWNLDTGQQEFSLKGHLSFIQSISLDAATGRLASASNDRMILVWDLARRKLVKTFDEHQKEVTQVSYLQNGRRLVSVAWDGRLIMRDLDPFRPRKHEFSGNNISGSAANTSQTYLVTVGGYHLGLWSINDSMQRVYQQQENSPGTASSDVPFYNCVTALPNDGGWLVGDRQGNIHHFVRTNERLKEVSPPRKSRNQTVTDLAMHPDGQRFISVGKPRLNQKAEVELWNLKSPEPTSLRTFDYPLYAVAIDSSGQYVAYAGDTKKAKEKGKPSLFIYDLTSEQEKTADHDFPRHIFDLQFQPGSRALAVVGDNNVVTLLDGKDWKQETKFYGHNYYIYSVSFSQNGQRLISGGTGGTIRIWDVKLGNPLLVLPIPDNRSVSRITLLEKQEKILAGYLHLYSWDYATPGDSR